MQTMRLSRNEVLLAAAIAAVAAGPLPAAEAQDRSTAQCLTIQANAPWQGTGIGVAPGQFVCVAAEGLWSHGGQGLQAITPFYGPQGFGKDEPNTVPEVVSRTGALIGRISGNAPFLIEKQLCFVPGASGELRLQMNDEAGAFDNNRGSMHVQVVKWTDYRWAPDRIALDPRSCKPR